MKNKPTLHYPSPLSLTGQHIHRIRRLYMNHVCIFLLLFSHDLLCTTYVFLQQNCTKDELFSHNTIVLCKVEEVYPCREDTEQECVGCEEKTVVSTAPLIGTRSPSSKCINMPVMIPSRSTPLRKIALLHSIKSRQLL